MVAAVFLEGGLARDLGHADGDVLDRVAEGAPNACLHNGGERVAALEETLFVVVDILPPSQYTVPITPKPTSSTLQVRSRHPRRGDAPGQR